ncbi:hypothetical protein C1646_760914 [Rhizophagus diaphanus]|nr:hypothetical protein C1646_760914 [Rhizophagus diaphanus] [Rhizophagus sp. MUCL 43196]
MSQLSEDILYLIFKVLTWCKTAVPILWKNPWKLKDSGWKTIVKLSIDYIILKFTNKESESSSILTNEIINLFINGSRKFTHLYIPYNFNFQIHLIPEVRSCLSEIEILSCNANINDDIGIKRLELFINDDNYRLIEAQQNFFNLDLKVHRDRPYTKLLASFINLKVLELDCGLISLIENTKGYLVEIKLMIHIFIELLIKDSHSEFENLLVNHCQNLTGLYILINESIGEFDWEKLFEILNISSPINILYITIKSNGKMEGDIENLIVEKYKSGIVKRFNNMILNDEFEWI